VRTDHPVTLNSADLSAGRREIVRLSVPSGVSMGEQYFDLVELDHFWVVRRFEVMCRFAAHLFQRGFRYCEIGCGNGALQRQLENAYGVAVDGFELCLSALEQNRSRNGKLYYYNILERKPELKDYYDVLFLFDVLEHIAEAPAFLQAASYHLKPGGYIIINVPARRELFSKYDIMAGHVRRYTVPMLSTLLEKAALQPDLVTYWGLPLYPVLFLRKLLMAFLSNDMAYRKGFQPPSKTMNTALTWLSRCEILPQRWLGTSILAVAQSRPQ